MAAVPAIADFWGPGAEQSSVSAMEQYGYDLISHITIKILSAKHDQEILC